MNKLILNCVRHASLLFFITTMNSAFADHGSWVLTESGANCKTSKQKFSGRPGENDDVGATNNVICPIVLGGRQVVKGNEHSNAHLSARARYASVSVVDNHPTEDIKCKAVATFDDGKVKSSDTVLSSGIGAQRLILNYNAKDTSSISRRSWGGDLEPNQNRELKALSFHCTLPPPAGSSFPRLTSTVNQYDVALCYSEHACAGQTFEHDFERIDRGQPVAKIIVMPSECEDVRDVHPNRPVLSKRGWVAAATKSSSIACPLHVPANDSHSHLIQISQGIVSINSKLGKKEYCALGYFDSEGHFEPLTRFVEDDDFLSFRGDYRMIENLVGIPFGAAPVLYCALSPEDRFNGAEFLVSRTEQNNGV